MQFTMKQQRKLILTLIFVMIFSKFSFGQIWPYTQMIRYGNAVYIDAENKGLIERNKTKILLEDGLENRFFDVLTFKDSIEVIINNKVEFFHQKERTEPKDSKMFLFYSRRNLRNEKQNIKYLKLIEISNDFIIAEATIKKKRSRNKKEIIKINIADIEGIFVGPGKKMRTVVPIIAITEVILFAILK